VTVQEMLDARRAEILEIAARHGAGNVRVDLDTVWRVVEDHLPDLRRQLEVVLRGIESS
jgi:hypothetical protein